MNINNIYIGIIISLLLVFIFVMTIAWLEDLRKLGGIYKRAHIFISNYKEHNKVFNTNVRGARKLFRNQKKK